MPQVENVEECYNHHINSLKLVQNFKLGKRCKDFNDLQFKERQQPGHLYNFRSAIS